MYPITAETAALFASNRRQVLDISVTGPSGELTLSESDIATGGFVLNRYSVTGDILEVGSAVAGEVQITLDNTDGRFNSVVFAGARLFIRVGVVVDGEHSAYVPLGFFTVDEAPRVLRSINFTALDDMVLFDKVPDLSLLSFPMTVDELVSRICDICNVSLGTNVASLPNGTFQVDGLTGDPATYRQILMWAAEITGTCAMIDWNGQLILKWYDGDSEVVLNTITRFSSDIAESQITITGIEVKKGDTVALTGTDEYALAIADNGLMTEMDVEEISQSLFTVLGGFSYLPYTVSTFPMPQFYPLDRIWVTGSSASFRTIITETTFVLNGSMSMAAAGITEVQKGYASLNPLTRRETAIIQQMLGEQNAELGDRVQTVLAFNELISNALGLYVTPVEQSDGSTIYYLHNSPNLSESSVIFTMTANGIAWTTTGWNDGSPVWSSGVTAAGDALFRLLSAEGIEVSKVGEDYNIEITPRAFRIYYRNMLVTNIEADEMTIPKAVFTDYAQCGKVRLVPYSTTGTNLVFID